jgi:hypothetical protein
MRMSQYPACCGGVIISRLPLDDRFYDSWIPRPKKDEEKAFEKSLKTKLNKAKFDDDRGFAMAVFAVGENAPFAKKTLQKYGFQEWDSEINPRTGHRLIHYKCDLKKIREPL